MSDEILFLDENLFIAKGSHKKCYLHPTLSDRCIKLPYTSSGEKDLNRELEFLKILRRKNKDYSVLPKYFGSVKTNVGIGHVYELIKDYDGNSSKTLEDYCRDEQLLVNNMELLSRLLRELKENLLTNEIITMGIWPENIIVQYGGADSQDYKLRLINDMGSAALIPLEYYFSYVAKKRIQKRWDRFMINLIKKYYSDGVSELVEKIR